MKVKLGDYVMIKWVDAATSNNWESYKDAPVTLAVESVGKVIHLPVKGKMWWVLVNMYNDEDKQSGMAQSIPKVCVKKVKILK